MTLHKKIKKFQLRTKWLWISQVPKTQNKTTKTST